MEYAEIAHGTTDYHAACTLRDTVMRRPIGLRLSEADTDSEETQHHFIARNDQARVMATVIFKPLSDTHIKLRQMAVDPALHGKGVGKELVQFAENAVKTKGFRTIETNARITAQGFYEKLGYVAGGGIFEEVGLPTIRMYKELSDG